MFNRFIFPDFEFSRSQERDLRLFCVSHDIVEDGKEILKEDVWLLDDPGSHKKLADFYLSIKDTTVFVCFGSAEPRCLLQLGLDPHDFMIIDLYQEGQQLRHNHEEYEYGVRFENGFKRTSVPPSYDPKKNIGRDNTKTKGSYAATVAYLFEECIDVGVKEDMRNLIIADLPTYTDQQRKDIIDYCRSDIKYLPMIFKEFSRKLGDLICQLPYVVQKIQILRGEFSCSVAKMEREGIPLDIDAAKNLRRNHHQAKEALISDLIKIHPFYERKKPKRIELLGEYTQKYDVFEKYVRDKGLYDKWEKTESKKLSAKDDYLEKWDGLEEIYALRQCNKSIKQINWFRKDLKKDQRDFFESVGEDNRLRPFFNPLGTQTCIAGDALVYSKQRGFIRITQVKTSDKLWDGEKFVNHFGLKYTGLREVIDFNGVRATPDHKFVNKKGEWENAETCDPVSADTPNGLNFDRLNNPTYQNSDGSNAVKIVGKCVLFDSGYISHSAKYVGNGKILCKDRYKKNDIGMYRGDILYTPTYQEASIKWKSMQRRVKNVANRISYVESSVCENWKNFSNFAEWYQANKNPKNTTPVVDKDYIECGNREYSPTKCLVITDRLNMLITGSAFKKKEGLLPIGVHTVDGVDGLYSTRINFNGTSEHIGVFDSISLAEEAYIAAKNNIFHKVLEEEKDFLTEKTYEILSTFRLGRGCDEYNTDNLVPVYDITDCGPDSRFAVYNNNLEGMIAHNSRNAPPARTFIFAMSAWLRCLVRPPKGKAICAIDWSSQEFAIAAALSNDKNMIDSYESGDPYAYFAKLAGAIPMDANMKWIKEYWNAPSDQQNTYKKYSNARSLFKSTVLGVQFGLGYKSLALKLTADTGRLVTEKESKKLLNLHKKSYMFFWRYLDDMCRKYRKRGYYSLWDGLSLLKDNDNDLSVKNFPVQGTGAVIMRRAAVFAHKRGLKLISTLHDALYIVFDEEAESNHPDILSECMHQAVKDVLGDKLIIRQDRDIHRHDEVWIEGKGKKFYELLSKYLEPMKTDEDLKNELMETIFK